MILSAIFVLFLFNFCHCEERANTSFISYNQRLKFVPPPYVQCGFNRCNLYVDYCDTKINSCESCENDCGHNSIESDSAYPEMCKTGCAWFYYLKQFEQNIRNKSDTYFRNKYTCIKTNSTEKQTKTKIAMIKELLALDTIIRINVNL